MIDTIHIELPWQELTNLYRQSNTIDNETGELLYSVGYKDCIKIRRVNGMMRIECSLSKLLKGNNVHTLDFFEIITAILKIEKLLKIPISKGVIRRIDLGITIETKYKPQDYFKYFGSSNYFVRSQTGNSSLYYKNRSRQKYFYDKVKEIKAKKGNIPEEFINMNIFRFECRYEFIFLKTLSQKFGYQSLTVENLITKEILSQLVELILNEYHSIQKINIQAFEGLKMASKTKFFEQLAYITISNLGQHEVLEMIDATKTIHPNVPKEYFSRRKGDVKALVESSQTAGNSDLLKEISEKIELVIFEIMCEIKR